jgi:hypothetical protein
MGCDAVLDRGPVLFSISIDRVENTEYHEAYKTILHKANRVPAAPYVAAMFGVFFLLYWLFDREPLSAGIALAILILIAAYFKWFNFRQLRAVRDRVRKDLPVRIIFMENGILSATKYGESFRKWEGFEGYAETRNTVTLLSTYLFYFVIPKRVLDAATLDSLQRLLHGKMKML